MLIVLHWTNIQTQLTKCGYTSDHFMLRAVFVSSLLYLSLKYIVLGI